MNSDEILTGLNDYIYNLFPHWFDGKVWKDTFLLIFFAVSIVNLTNFVCSIADFLLGWFFSFRNGYFSYDGKWIYSDAFYFITSVFTYFILLRFWEIYKTLNKINVYRPPGPKTGR